METVDLERQRLTQEIYDSFDGVSREGGISWSEASCRATTHDQWMEYAKSRPEGEEILTYPDFPQEFKTETEGKNFDDLPFHDRDLQWPELVDDVEWEGFTERGRFFHVDPVARRYYLPAALIRSLREDSSPYLAIILTALHDFPIPEGLPDPLEEFGNRWSALNERQRICVNAFVKFNMDIEGAIHDARLAHIIHLIPEQTRESMLKYLPWRRAYLSYWVSV